MTIIVRVSDGLGNQMFQYAFARKLQVLNGGNVYLDTRYINNEDLIAREANNLCLRYNDCRDYKLNKFRITLSIAEESVLSKWNYIGEKNNKEKLIAKLAQKGFWLWQYKDEEKRKNGQLINKAACRLPTYFRGYFFNLNYYEDIKPILQREFRPRKPVVIPNKLRYVLQYKNTVSIHIRRGDFIKLHRSICKDRYYSKAVKWIENRIDKPIYLIFSDDIEWVKENLCIDSEKIYVSDMGFEDYEEFTIMKHCRHNIIANSTFSYWAAYLNDTPNKIVIYPEGWEKITVIPDDWIGISTYTIE